MNLLQRLAGFALGIVFLLLALVFASVILAVAAALAMVFGAWLWWRTRALRRAAREGEGVVVEGEYRVEREVRRLDDPDR